MAKVIIFAGSRRYEFQTTGIIKQNRVKVTIVIIFSLCRYNKAKKNIYNGRVAIATIITIAEHHQHHNL